MGLKKKTFIFVGIILLVLVGAFFLIKQDVINVGEVNSESGEGFISQAEGDNNQTITYTDDTKTTCNGNSCSVMIHSGSPRYAKNSSDDWVDAGQVLSLTKNSDDITFHYDGINGQMNLTMEVGVIYNGTYKSMQTVKQQVPSIDFIFPHTKNKYGAKYDVNMTGIPTNTIPYFTHITFTYKTHSGFPLSKLNTYQGKMVANGVLNLGFQDAIDDGFPLEINKTERRIYLSNISNNIKANSLYIDPSAFLNNTSEVQVAGLRRDAGTYGMGLSTEIDVWNTHANNIRYLIRFINVTDNVGADATITDAKMGLYVTTKFTNGDYSVYRLFKPWEEGNGTGVVGQDIGTDSGTTSNNWDNYNSFAWTESGAQNGSDSGSDNSGDGTGADRKSTPEDTQTITAQSQYWEFDLSNALVQGWYDGTINEEGVLMFNDNVSDSAFTTDDHTTIRPYLNVSYTVGGGGGDSCGCVAGQDWKVDCSDNCNNLSVCDISGFNVILSGSGTFTVGSDIYFDELHKDKQCTVNNAKNDGNALINNKG